MKAFLNPHKIKLVFFLLICWILISGYMFFGSDIGITTIGDDSPQFKQEMQNGQVQRFEIVSEHDNFGVILFQFRPPRHVPSSKLMFQLKEKDRKNPIATIEFTYHALYSQYRFPIGFPVIKSSKGKTYYIDFINKENNSSLGFDKEKPIIETRYVYSKEELFSQSTKHKVEFVYTKIISLITSKNYIMFLALYIVFCIIAAHKWDNAKSIKNDHSIKIFGILTLFAVLGSLLSEYSNLIFFIELTLLAIIVKKCKLKKPVLIQSAVLFFIISTILLLTNQTLLSEHVSIQFILIILTLTISYILPDKINFKYNDQ